MYCYIFVTLLMAFFQCHYTACHIIVKTEEQVATKDCHHFCDKQYATDVQNENITQCQCTPMDIDERNGPSSDTTHVTPSTANNHNEFMQHDRQTRSVSLDEPSCEHFCKNKGYSGSLFQKRLKYCQCYFQHSVAYDTYKQDGSPIGEVDPPNKNHGKTQHADQNPMALVLHHSKSNSAHDDGSSHSSSSGRSHESGPATQSSNFQHSDSSSIKAHSGNSDYGKKNDPQSGHSQHSPHASNPQQGTITQKGNSPYKDNSGEDQKGNVGNPNRHLLTQGKGDYGSGLAGETENTNHVTNSQSNDPKGNGKQKRNRKRNKKSNNSEGQTSGPGDLLSGMPGGNSIQGSPLGQQSSEQPGVQQQKRKNRKRKGKQNGQQSPITGMPYDSSWKTNNGGQDGNQQQNGRNRKVRQNGQDISMSGMPGDSSLENNAGGQDGNQRRNGRKHKGGQNGQDIPKSGGPLAGNTDVNTMWHPTNGNQRDDFTTSGNSDRYSAPFAGLHTGSLYDDDTGKHENKHEGRGKNGESKTNPNQNGNSIVGGSRKRNGFEKNQKGPANDGTLVSTSGQAKRGDHNDPSSSSSSNSDNYRDPFAGLQSDNLYDDGIGSKTNPNENSNSMVRGTRKGNRSQKNKDGGGGLNAENQNGNKNGHTGLGLNAHDQIQAPPSSASHFKPQYTHVVPGHEASFSNNDHDARLSLNPSYSGHSNLHSHSSSSTSHSNPSPSDHSDRSHSTHHSDRSPSIHQSDSSLSSHFHPSTSSGSGHQPTLSKLSSHESPSSSSASSNSNSMQRGQHLSANEKILPDSRENCEKFCAHKAYEGGERYNANRHVCQCYTQGSVSYDEYDKNGICISCSRFKTKKNDQM